eukprot:363695-Chlamydomonas_euryale.AAC.10
MRPDPPWLPTLSDLQALPQQAARARGAQRVLDAALQLLHRRREPFAVHVRHVLIKVNAGLHRGEQPVGSGGAGSRNAGHAPWGARG